jgi:hypothetical protein
MQVTENQQTVVEWQNKSVIVAAYRNGKDSNTHMNLQKIQGTAPRSWCF